MLDLKNKIREKATYQYRLLYDGKFEKQTGWLNPFNYCDELTNRIIKTAEDIRQMSDILVIIGAGGSYMGSKAIIEALTHKYIKDTEVVYIGNNLSPLDIEETIEYLRDKSFTVNVISKSGNTLEVNVAFELIKELLIEKYSYEKAMNRIIVTTGSTGPLRKFASENNVNHFLIPDNIGGRYSVFTPVGLLPAAVSGVDIKDIIAGAKLAYEELKKGEEGNEAIEYATIRNTLHLLGKDIELLAVYEPRLRYFTEWWKQLFAESEGKDGVGIFPAGAVFTTDLHSLGQLIQEGKDNLFETHLSFNKPSSHIETASQASVLSNQSISELNKKARKATIKAHLDGGVHTIKLTVDTLDAKGIGQLMYFFKLSCAISGLTLGVNPFNQPGVENYKRNMREMLKE